MTKKITKNNNMHTFVLAAVILVVAVLFIFSMWQLFAVITPKNSVQVQNDICAPQSGYTPESWREHMSHHPDQYEKCLK